MKYTVIKQHFSGQRHQVGDERECDERLAKELIERGLIVEEKEIKPTLNKSKQDHKTK